MDQQEPHRGSAIQNAVNYIKRSNLPIRRVAGMYGVPESTLRLRLKNSSRLDVRTRGRPTLFSRPVERQLADHCKRMARLGYGYTSTQVIQVAENMVIETDQTIMPKKDWYYGFIKRFPDLVIQKPKKRELSRVTNTTNENLKEYFDELERVLNKYNLKNKPEVLWNVDETGVMLDHTPPKIVTAKGDNAFVITAGKSATTTVIAAGSALGETIPPYIIFKGHRQTADITSGCLPGTKYTVTPNGWSTSETFLDFISNHFLTHVKTRPCILLYDGHSTHITLDVIEKARENNVHMFVLPPHSSHQLQPLDVGIFSPFKSSLSSEMHQLTQREVGRTVTRTDLPGLIAKAYRSAFTVSNLMSAFRKSGLQPFNPDEVMQETSSTSAAEVEPKTRKDRSNVRRIKMLLNDVDSRVSDALATKPATKRKYIVPTFGAAVTEDDFVEKLTQQAESRKTVDKRKKQKSVQKTKPNEQEKRAQVSNETAGPSKEWVTFYNSQSEDGDDDNDDVPCCICNLFAPIGFGRNGTIELLGWAKCDTCKGWVHLKYCTNVRSVANGEPFTCPNC